MAIIVIYGTVADVAKRGEFVCDASRSGICCSFNRTETSVDILPTNRVGFFIA